MKKYFLSLFLPMFVACSQEPELLLQENFEREVDGQTTHLYTLTNTQGCYAQFTDYGGRWLSMWVPDAKGEMQDVLLGFDTLDGYMKAMEGYHGAITGRVCGRINGGQFEMDGTKYTLANNDLYGKPVKNHLHGGWKGFHKMVWQGTQSKNEAGEEYVEFKYVSKDGEEGYPGELHVKVRYTLTQDNTLRIEYRATTDKPTLVNLTNHAFFNLSGNPAQSVNDQEVVINADNYISCDEELIPTGEIVSAKSSPIDFTQGMPIGQSLNEHHSQILLGRGYAIAYALNEAPEGLTHAASLSYQPTGIHMDVYTNQPSLQFYNAWLMDGTDVGKRGIAYQSGAGVALETQGYPDAPNHDNFPSIRLNPDKEYYHVAEYRFKNEK